MVSSGVYNGSDADSAVDRIFRHTRGPCLPPLHTNISCISADSAMDTKGVGNNEIRPPQSVTQMLGAESSSDEIVNLPAVSLSIAIEYAQTALDKMHMKLNCKDAGVLSSLKEILVGLMRVVEIAKVYQACKITYIVF